MFYPVDRLILPSFILHYWICRWLHKLAKEEFFSPTCYSCREKPVGTHPPFLYWSSNLNRPCSLLRASALLANSQIHGYKWLGTAHLHLGEVDPRVCVAALFSEPHPSLTCPCRDGRPRPLGQNWACSANVGGAELFTPLPLEGEQLCIDFFF